MYSEVHFAIFKKKKEKGFIYSIKIFVRSAKNEGELSEEIWYYELLFNRQTRK